MRKNKQSKRKKHFCIFINMYYIYSTFPLLLCFLCMRLCVGYAGWNPLKKQKKKNITQKLFSLYAWGERSTCVCFAYFYLCQACSKTTMLDAAATYYMYETSICATYIINTFKLRFTIRYDKWMAGWAAAAGKDIHKMCITRLYKSSH